MKTRLAAVAAIVLAISTIAPEAQTPPPTSFRYERPILVAGAGPHRLAIDVPMITAGTPFKVTTRSSEDAERRAIASGGLVDLRLFNPAGAEIPHLLVPSPDDAPIWRTAAALLPVAPVENEKKRTSGFEADLGEPATIDRFRFDRLAPPFLKVLRLEGSGDRAHWTLLVEEGTVFDLPASRLRHVEIGFPAGTYRYLRVTWDDTRSGRVGPPTSVSARVVSSVTPPPALTTSVVFERRPSEPGRSRFRLRLPAARLPIVALELDVASGHVMRDIEVSEARLTGAEAVPAVIGRGTLKRVEQGSLAATALVVQIQPPVEPELDVVVDDGNNPPLDLRGVTARFAELPWIYFETQGAAMARYGNPALSAPRYDLEAVRQTVRIDRVADAVWGTVRERGEAETQAAASPPALPTVGAEIDATKFQYLRGLPPGDGGLIGVSLDEAVLVHSSGVTGRFADVRIIDDDGNQIPYLLERSAEPLSKDATLERVESPPAALGTKSKQTVYRLQWPYDKLPASRLALTTSARVFQRKLSVAAQRQPDRRHREAWIETFASASWAHTAQETPAPALTITLPAIDASELLLTVAEGDNTVLPITGARLLFPQYRLRFFREVDAELTLAYGQPELTAPSYDLALLAPRLLGVNATEVTPEPEPGENGPSGTSLLSPGWFWGVLGVAVIVLVGVIVRLLRKQAV
jgi:hypothetical protein